MDLIIENHQCPYVIYGWIIYLDCIDISTDVSQDIRNIWPVYIYKPVLLV